MEHEMRMAGLRFFNALKVVEQSYPGLSLEHLEVLMHLGGVGRATVKELTDRTGWNAGKTTRLALDLGEGHRGFQFGLVNHHDGHFSLSQKGIALVRSVALALADEEPNGTTGSQT